MIDGIELTADMETLWTQGKLNPVSAVLMGTNKDEGTHFIALKPDATVANYTSWVLMNFGASLGQVYYRRLLLFYVFFNFI